MQLFPHSRLTRPVTVLAVLFITIVAGCSSPEERAQSHYTRGAEYLEAGDHTRAMLEFRNAVKLDEKHTSAWYAIARIEEKAHNWRAVARALRRVIELDAAHVEARIKLARLELAAGDTETALALANAANALKLDDSEIHALRGAVLLRLNDRAGARSDAERALSLDRENPDAYAVLAADALIGENTTAALRFVERGLHADPQNSGLLLLKLRIHEQEEDFRNAESVMRQLVVANPGSKDIRRALVAFLVDRERPGDAETEMRALVAADPNDTAAAIELVRFVDAQRGADAARHELLRLIEANPEAVDYELAMARLDFSNSQPEAAVGRLRSIISRNETGEAAQRARLLLAEMMLQGDDSEAAATLIADVLAADAKNADALALRARLHLRSRDYDSATADLREALNEEPQSVRLYQLLAKAFERQGVIDLANDNYVQAVRAANYAPEISLDYARFLSSRGDLARVEAILSESLSRAPNNAEVLSMLGQVRLRQQDWVGAQEAAELLKKLGDRPGTGDQILGAALLGQNRIEKGIETLKGAYSASPQAVRPLYTLVTAYVRSGKVDQAEAFLDTVLTANPDNADAHVLLGFLHAMRDEPEQSVAAYRTAVERQPENAAGYRALAAHLIARDKVAEAEAVLLRGRQRAPEDLGLSLIHAGLLEKKPDPDGALAIYEDLLENRPDALVLINNVASLIAEHRTDEDSLDRAYRLALRLRDVDVAQFKDTLGWVLYRRGDYDAAVEYLESAVEGLPDHPLVRYHLARTYAALARHDDAKAQFTRAAELVDEGEPLAEKVQDALREAGESQTLN